MLDCESTPWVVTAINSDQLAAVVRNCIENVLILDSRSFLEYNTCHVIHSVNLCCSKIAKRRLQLNKVTVQELLFNACDGEIDKNYKIIVYDHSSSGPNSIPPDTFVQVLLEKLIAIYPFVYFLEGGFLQFQASQPSLCEDKTRKCPLTSLSQPCLSVTHMGPTKILPFLYLGSQFDSLNHELLQKYNITYTLNISNSCPKPDFIPEGHFLRIPVNDNYNEKLLPHFTKAFQFLDKVREASGCVLVHCLAGISRSPTIAIAYVMKYLRMTSDDAYRYVKSKRATISPNFNFLGQLLEFEKILRFDKVLADKPEHLSAPAISANGQKRFCQSDMREKVKNKKLTLNILSPSSSDIALHSSNNGDQSPTTALAKLSFNIESSPTSCSPPETKQSLIYPKYRSMSCHAVMADACEDSKVEWSKNDIRNNLTMQSSVIPSTRDVNDLKKNLPNEETFQTSSLENSNFSTCAAFSSDKTRSILASSSWFSERQTPIIEDDVNNTDTVSCVSWKEERVSSGMGSESSDIIPPLHQEISDDIVFEDDPMDISVQVCLREKHPFLAKCDSGYLSLTLSDIKCPFLKPLNQVESPISPSEAHLLDDLEDTSLKPKLSSENDAGNKTDKEDFLDSGILLSPSRFLSTPFPKDHPTNSSSLEKRLHRAQSCPMILGWLHMSGSNSSVPSGKVCKRSHGNVSRKNNLVRRSLDFSQIRYDSVSSCPDMTCGLVQHDGETRRGSNSKNSDQEVFRRPISLIQVS